MNADGSAFDLDEDLERARRRLYQAGATQEHRAAYERTLDHGRREPTDAPSSTVPVEAVAVSRSTAPSEHVREPRGASVALLAVVVSAAFAATTIGSRGEVEPPSATAPLATVISRDPALLPAAWEGATVFAAGDALDGATPLAVSHPGRVLLVVRCPAADRSFQVQFTGGSSGTWSVSYGACGRLQVLPLTIETGTDSGVLVTTRGVEPFSAALLEHR